MINWSICEEKFIKKVEIDKEKIASLIETSSSRLKYIKSIIPSKENISFIVEGYYETIKELLVALLLSNGLRSNNHQCLISFFYTKYREYEAESHLMSQMCYLRNRLEYYGEKIDFEFYSKNKNEFDKIIRILKKLVIR